MSDGVYPVPSTRIVGTVCSGCGREWCVSEDGGGYYCSHCQRSVVEKPMSKSMTQAELDAIRKRLQSRFIYNVDHAQVILDTARQLFSEIERLRGENAALSGRLDAGLLCAEVTLSHTHNDDARRIELMGIISRLQEARDGQD